MWVVFVGVFGDGRLLFVGDERLLFVGEGVVLVWMMGEDFWV